MDHLKILHIGNGNAYKTKAIATYFQARGHEIHFVSTAETDERWPGIQYHVFEPAKIDPQNRSLKKACIHQWMLPKN